MTALNTLNRGNDFPVSHLNEEIQSTWQACKRLDASAFPVNRKFEDHVKFRVDPRGSTSMFKHFLGSVCCLASILAVVCGTWCNASPARATTEVSAAVQVTVQSAGTGTGTVTSSPSGINCPQTCTASFPKGSKVVLTAAPTAGTCGCPWLRVRDKAAERNVRAENPRV